MAYVKQFHDHGSHYCFSLIDDTVKPLDHLPAAVYELLIDSNPLTGIKIKFNKTASKFTVPEKRFGAHQRHLERIRSDYDRVNPSMGVMLEGLKGSGKSMFAEDLGNWIIGSGLPVLMVSSAIPVEILRGAISMIGPCMVYFDEFGKVYSDRADRDRLLSLFSDSTLTGVLFVITGNTEQEFTDAIYDRPGRFKYRLKFSDLKTAAAIEVGEHYHLEPHLILGLARYLNVHNVSYDMLCTIATMIRGCKTDHEVRDYLEIMNVPRWPRVEPRIMTLMFEDQPFLVNESSVRWDGNQLKVRGCKIDQKSDIRELTIPLAESIDYYMNHEASETSDPRCRLVHGSIEMTYNFKVVYSYSRNLTAKFDDILHWVPSTGSSKASTL